MERISSGSTFFMKRVFPVVWVGFILLFVAMAASRGAAAREPVGFVVMPIVMIAIGAFSMRRFLWNVADEVRDGGAFLMVRKSGVEERVALADIMNVDFQGYTNPKVVTLRLRKAGRLGDEVKFFPRSQFRLNPFARHPLADALIVRIDRARQTS